jgi:2-haloacid dehalogenase
MIQALTFDVFGTVVDWRSSIIREGELLARAKGLEVDWPKFADAWRAGYAPSMDKVRKGELPWTNIDGLHRMILDGLMKEFSLEGLNEKDLDHLNRAWHRLMPWPDAVGGLNRLRGKFTLATLSNGNVSLLVDMAKNAGLPWDCVMSAELFGHYKPDPEAYLGAAKLLGLEPAQVMMVAAHPNDLRAAARAGLKTAYVPRPLEHGPRGKQYPPEPANAFDVIAADFVELAARLGA